MADQRIQYTEEMVGAGHPTKSDTLNRLSLVEHNTDGTHKDISATSVTASGVVKTNSTGTLDVAAGKTVNIDDDVTIAAELHVEAATHLNQDLTTDAGPTFDHIHLTSQPFPPPNLLTNTEWKAMSGSTLVEATSGAAPVTSGANAALVNNLLTNGGFDSATTGWDAGANAVLSSYDPNPTYETGNCLKIAGSGGNYQNTNRIISGSMVSGKLYQLNLWVKDSDTSSSVPFVVYLYPYPGWNSVMSGTTTASWVKYTYTFEYDGTTNLGLYISVNTADTKTFLVDSVTLYEVTPGYVAADAVAPDGWSKQADGTINLFQEFSGSNTKEGSFYALKCVTTTAARFWWADNNRYTKSEFYEKYLGRTVAIGAWIKTSTSNLIKLQALHNGTWNDISAYHPGSGDYEWLEGSFTVNASSTEVIPFGVYFSGAGTAYFSQPMLVFGSSIGQGNYQPIPNEVIWLQRYITVESNTAITASVAKNVEAWTEGEIGKGVKAVNWIISGKNSAANKEMYLSESSSAYDYLDLRSQVANIPYSVKGWNATDANGDVYVYVEDANWSEIYIRATAIQT